MALLIFFRKKGEQILGAECASMVMVDTFNSELYDIVFTILSAITAKNFNLQRLLYAISSPTKESSCLPESNNSQARTFSLEYPMWIKI